MNAFLFFLRTVLHSLTGVGSSCRMRPTCYEYSQEVFAKFPFWRGLGLTVKRLVRCRPGGSIGWDPTSDHGVGNVR